MEPVVPAPEPGPGPALVPRPPPGGRVAEAWRARWGSLTRDSRVVVGGLVIAAAVAFVVSYRAASAGGPAAPAARAGSAARPSRARPSPTDATTPAVGGAAGSRTSSSPTAAPRSNSSRVVVHVAGAVVHPGVVELPAGGRVVDAVDAAGGAQPDADLDRVNLAARLVDGQQILIGRRGEVAAAAGPSGAGAPGATGPGNAGPGNAASGTAGGPAGPLNLNTATVEQLDALPGIGPSLARAIVDERNRRGGFRSVNELRSVRGIGDRRFADLRPLVSV
ncbi:MAG: ComEA family DNA-binding protein [Acidimicrobiia bacterium]